MTEETSKKSVKAPPRYAGFGAPDEFGAHVFNVVIPVAAKDAVTVVEDYGLKGGENGLPRSELRIVLPRRSWAAVAEIARKDFSTRLKAKKFRVGRWTTGENKVDRLLGRELCVLLWAVEHARSVDECKTIAARWSAYRPEERWWLYSQTAAEARLAEDTQQGWRKALYFAMSSQPSPRALAGPGSAAETDMTLPLFA